jgi:two-component sensor histidine kinase
MKAEFDRLLMVLVMAWCIIGQATGQSRSSLLVKELPIKVLREKASSVKHDTSSIALLFEVAQHYASKAGKYNAESHFNDSAIFFLKLVLQLSDSLHYNQYINQSRDLLGKVYLLNGQVEEGTTAFRQAIQLEQALHNKEKEADLWTRMGQSFLREYENYDEIQSCLTQAIRLYQELKLWEKEADVQIKIADLEMYRGHFKKCESLLLDVLELYRKHKKSKTFNIYYLLSVSNRYDGDLSSALSYAMKCVSNMREEKDTLAAGYFYGEMGLLYQGLNKTEESIHWYRQALNKVELRGNKTEIYFTAGFLIQQLIKQKREKEALQLLDEMNINYPPVLTMEKACAAQCYARCYEALKKFEAAEHYYLEMIKHYLKYNRFDEYVVIAFRDIGSFYLQQKKYDLARPYLIKALQMPLGLNFSTWERKKDLHLMLFKADSAQGNYIDAIDHLNKHHQLNDSIFNAEKMHEIEKLQTQFKIAEKENEIVSLNNNNKIQQQELKQAATVRNFVIAGILIILAFVYYRYKLKQKSNLQLEEQQKEINKKNQHLEHLVKEREWLLKEIHHRVKNNFQMVTSLLGTQTHYIKSEEALQYIEESQHRVYAMSLIHQRLYLAGNYSSINMKNYIHELVDYLRNSITIRQHIVFEIEAEEIELDIAHALPIGLILNEAITNSIKYAFTGRDDGKITILLQQKSETEVRLQVADNGIGMPPGMNREQSVTMGMNLMKGLSEEIEGVFSIGTNNGTVIQLVFNYEFNPTLLPYSLPPL